MKKTTLLLSITSLLLISTGCEKKKEEKPKETFKSYDYYVAHKQEMLERHKECEKINYEVSEAVRVDCRNADAAKSYYKMMSIIKK